jgi:hypothetical protein
VYYADGSQVDLVAQAKSVRDLHVHTNGQLRLLNDADRIVFVLDPNRSVETVYMMADSWIAPEVPVELSMALTHRSSVLAPVLP